MSLSFMFGVPGVVGYLSQIGDDSTGARWRWSALVAFFAPMVPVTLMLVLVGLLNLEGSICILMAAPVFLLFAGLGGVSGWATRGATADRARNVTTALVVALPYM